METDKPLTPIENGTTWAIPGSELAKDAHQRGDVVLEVSSNSPGSVGTVIIDMREADEVTSAPGNGSDGWTSVVIQTRPDQWMNLVVFDVDVLIAALQRAKR
jgi:hypothetical protein